MMDDFAPIRTAVVGCGYWGKNLVRNFAQESVLQMCCDGSPSVRARLEREYPGVQVVASYEDVIKDPGIEAVVLATPATYHADMAVAALSHGKHVFVEKPLALNTGDAQRVVQVADRSDRILMVGHLMEYHPAVTYIKEMIETGYLGDIRYIYSQRVNLGKVRSDENALWSLAPHDVSIMYYLLDEEAEQVQASGQAFLQEEIEDVVFLTLRFPSGRIGHIHVSWLDPHKERRLTVVGSKRMVVFDDVHPKEKVRVYDKGVERKTTEAAEYASYADLMQLREGDVLIPSLPSTEPLALECKAFLHAIHTGDAPRSDGADGLRVVTALENAQEALNRNALPFVGG